MAKKSALAIEFEKVASVYKKPDEIIAFFESKTAKERKELWEILIKEKNDGGFLCEHDCWPVYKTLFEKKYISDSLKPAEFSFVLADFWYFIEYKFSNLKKLATHLAKEKLLLDGIWLMFGQASEAYPFGRVDKDWDQCWTNAFLELVEQKAVDRSRLMDALLDTLKQGYSDYQARWYAQMFQALKPSPSEIAARNTVFATLLESRTSSTALFAFEYFEFLDKNGLSDDAMFLKHCAAILRDKSKAKVGRVLKYIEKAIFHSPSLSKSATEALLQTLKHESPEIQASAIKIFRKNPTLLTESVTESIKKLAPSLAPSVRAELKGIDISSKSPPQKNSTIKSTEPLRKTRIPERLTGLPVLKPIQSVDGLIDLALKILADPSDNMEHELFLDGLDRLHDKRDNDFERKTSSICKKIIKDTSMTGIMPIHSWTERDSNDDVLEIGCYGHALCALMAIWLAESRTIHPNGDISIIFNGGKTILSFRSGPTIDALFICRTANLARRICNGITQQPLSTPTHAGGWIDPVVFVKRLLLKFGEKNAYYDMLDYIYALYRLAPDQRQEALKLLKGKEDRLFSKTLKYLLGDSDVSFTKTEIHDAAMTSESIPTDAEEKARKIMEAIFEPYSQRVLGFLGQLHGQSSKERMASLEKQRTNTKFQVEIEVLRELAAHMSFDCPELMDEKKSDPNSEKEAALKEKKRLDGVIQKSLITAALRLRDPSSDPIRYSLEQFPASPPEQSRWNKRNKDNDYFPLYYIHKPYEQPMHYENTWVVAQIRWRTTVFPSHRESLYWHALLPLIEHIEAGGNYQGPNGFIEPLLDPQEPMGEAATAATLVALAAKQQSLSTLAQDILIAAIGDGRLDSQRLAVVVDFHLRNELPKTNRWIEKFAVIADVSLEHAAVIRAMLERCLPAIPTKQLGPFVDLLYELSVAAEAPITEPTTTDFLKKLTGKNGQTAKKLLAIQ